MPGNPPARLGELFYFHPAPPGARGATRLPRRWAIIGAIDPRPVFGAFTKAAANRVHQDVTDFLLFFVMIAQTVVEEISLPIDLRFGGEEMFPVGEDCFHRRFAWKRNDGMEVIRHEEHQSAVPRAFLVVVRGSGEHGIARAGSTDRVGASRLAVDRDEEERTFRDPRRNLVRKSCALRPVH